MLTENFNALHALIAAPFWLSAASAPGYLYVWSGRVESAALTAPLRSWLMASLCGVLVASIAGIIIGLPLIVPVPFAAGSTFCSCLLLVRFYRFVNRPASAA